MTVEIHSQRSTCNSVSSKTMLNITKHVLYFFLGWGRLVVTFYPGNVLWPHHTVCTVLSAFSVFIRQGGNTGTEGWSCFVVWATHKNCDDGNYSVILNNIGILKRISLGSYGLNKFCIPLIKHKVITESYILINKTLSSPEILIHFY